MEEKIAEKVWNQLKNRANYKYKKGKLANKFNWEKKDFVNWYTNRDRICFYCHINEKEFENIWGLFYGGNRGKLLEVDRKDNKKGYNENNCVLACSLCNCAKSDKIDFEDFIRVGEVVKSIWMKRR